jgi:hypothetical protein
MEDLSQQVRRGMEVVTTDGAKLGKVSEVWFGTSVGGAGLSDEETCMEIHRGLISRETLYVPCRAIVQIDGQTIRLNVDESTVRDTPSWHRKPSWVSS